MSDEKIVFLEEHDTTPSLSYDDLLSILNNNRDRVRTFANLLIAVDSLLFSSALIVLFFAIDSTLPQNSVILIALGLVLLLISVFSGILATLLPPPMVSIDKFELVNLYTAIYQREYRIVRISAIASLAAMFVFVLAMVWILVLVL